MNKKDGIFISNKDLDNLQKIIDYLLDSEQNHYKEYIGSNFQNLLSKGFNNDDYILSSEIYNNADINHIYAITRKLKDALS